MIYRALDVANYIVKKSLDLNKQISNLKLQKVLYYLQARYLVEKGYPIFEDNIGKWKYGPVTPSVYHEYKRFGSGAIENVSDQLEIKKDAFGNITDISIKQFNPDTIEAKDQCIIDNTVNSLGAFGAFELVNRTHQQSIWKKYESEIISGINLEYDDEEIKNYFISNPEEQIWKQLNE
jgi:uncharacterized phage-associated protein